MIAMAFGDASISVDEVISPRFFIVYISTLDYGNTIVFYKKKHTGYG